MLSTLTFGSAENTSLNLDYSEYHNNLIQSLFNVCFREMSSSLGKVNNVVFVSRSYLLLLVSYSLLKGSV